MCLLPMKSEELKIFKVIVSHRQKKTYRSNTFVVCYDFKKSNRFWEFGIVRINLKFLSPVSCSLVGAVNRRWLSENSRWLLWNTRWLFRNTRWLFLEKRHVMTFPDFLDSFHRVKLIYLSISFNTYWKPWQLLPFLFEGLDSR